MERQEQQKQNTKQIGADRTPKKRSTVVVGAVDEGWGLRMHAYKHSSMLLLLLLLLLLCCAAAVSALCDAVTAVDC